MKDLKIKVEIEIRVTKDDIDDILSGALVGGISYWCSRAEPVGGWLGEFTSEQIGLGGELWLYESEGGQVYKLNQEKLLKGIEMYFHDDSKPYDIFERIEEGYRLDTMMADAVVCDMVIQYGLFGEIVFS